MVNVEIRWLFSGAVEEGEGEWVVAGGSSNLKRCNNTPLIHLLIADKILRAESNRGRFVT